MTGEKIGHQLHVLIGCVINVGEAKAGFKGLEQREVVVFDVALDTGRRVVRIDDGHHLIWETAVIILVPNDNDHVVALLPGPGGFDCVDQRMQASVTLCDGILVD